MATFDGIPLTTLQTWLSEAQTAYHALNTGQQVVSLSQGTTSLSFTAAQVPQLRKYIADLQGAINALTGSTRVLRGVYLMGGKSL